MKFGLKIWSNDKKEMFLQAKELCKKGKFDFVEIYLVPQNFAKMDNEILKIMQGVPVSIHAPHLAHGFDVFLLDEKNVKMFNEQVKGVADYFKSKFIVVHAEGMDQNQEFKTFSNNFKKIADPRILIENLPKFGLEDKLCFGFSLEQLEFVKSLGINICLDFSHSIKSALGQGLNYKKFTEELVQKLQPNYFHLCNGKLDNTHDEHLDLFSGQFDVKWIRQLLESLAKNKEIYLVFETPKAGNGLENDIKNMEYFKNL